MKAEASVLLSPLDMVLGWRTGSHLGYLRRNGKADVDLLAVGPTWTLATLDGTQYHIDVTWGDQYGRTNLRYFGMSEEQSYQCHPWGTADKKK